MKSPKDGSPQGRPSTAIAAQLDDDLREMYAKWDSSDVPPMIYDIENYEMSSLRAWATEARSCFYPGTPVRIDHVEERLVPGVDGNEIPVRIIWPHAGATNTVVFFHGGAWVRGDLDSHDPEVRLLAVEAGAVVVNVGYRLAPENRFPAAFDDALSAYRWVLENIADLGGDANRIAVAGDSAGGTIAAAVAIAARNKSLPLAAQLLIYPPTGETPRAGESVITAVLGPHESNDPRLSDPRLSPQFAEATGLAPAVIGVGTLDRYFRDNCAYASKLAAAGVVTVFRTYPRLPHGFLLFGAVSARSREATSELYSDLRRMIERSEVIC